MGGGDDGGGREEGGSHTLPARGASLRPLGEGDRTCLFCAARQGRRSGVFGFAHWIGHQWPEKVR